MSSAKKIQKSHIAALARSKFAKYVGVILFSFLG